MAGLFAAVVTFFEEAVLPLRPEEGISSPVSGSRVPRYFLLGIFIVFNEGSSYNFYTVHLKKRRGRGRQHR